VFSIFNTYIHNVENIVFVIKIEVLIIEFAKPFYTD